MADAMRNTAGASFIFFRGVLFCGIVVICASLFVVLHIPSHDSRSLPRKMRRNVAHNKSKTLSPEMERRLIELGFHDPGFRAPIITQPPVPTEGRNQVDSSSKLVPKLRARPTKPPEKRLPNCLVIGVRKGGTRPLLRFLSEHPEVVAVGPETGFFSNDVRYSKGVEWYKEQMPLVHANQILCEKSADYFQSQNAPLRVHEMNPDMKLILMVRHPINRMISDYHFIRRYAQKVKPEDYHFKELDYSLEDLVFNKTTGMMKYDHGGLYRSRYNKFIKNWLDWFPLEQILILDGDAFIEKNPALIVAKAERFLGVTPRATEDDFFFSNQKKFWCSKTLGCFGEEKGHKFPRLDETVTAKLKQYFAPFNRDFYKIVGQDFHWK